MNMPPVLACLVLTCCCLHASNGCPQQWQIYGTIGSEVVNQVLAIIECSGIFEDDQNFMRRLAYVETKDGTEGQGTTGIWNVTVQHLKAMLYPVVLRNTELSDVNDQICTKLGVNIMRAVRNPERQDLRNPLVSGVIARFYLYYVVVVNGQQIPVSGQATFWKSHFKMNAETATIDHFTKRLQEIPQCPERSRTCPPQSLHRMYQDGASGSDVVEAVVKKLNDSCIFPPDHGFMRRIAYVETRDGTNITENTNVTNEHKRVGIWGLTEFMLQNMSLQLQQNSHKTIYDNLAEYSEQVYRRFGVNMTGDETLNMRIPLVSGIAVRLYLEYLTVLENGLPEDLAGQAIFWALYYRETAGSIGFEEGVLELEGCRVNADIMFVLDMSHSISNTNLREEFSFVEEFARSLTIGRLDDRVGVVLFGDYGHVMFNMSEHNNKHDLLQAIKGLLQYALGERHGEIQNTNTAHGLTETIDVFTSDIREPRQSNTVYRVAIVVSDGKSDNRVSTIREAQKLHNITPTVLVYAIGVDGVDEREMRAIAGDYDHYTHMDNFDREGFRRLRKHQLEDICLNATQEIKQKLFEGELDEKEVMRYVTFVPAEGLTVQVCSSEGRVIVSVFCQASGDSDHFKFYKPICTPDNTTNNGSCKCMDVFINGTTGPPGEGPQKQHSRRRARRETNTTEVHITIEGMERENVFTVDIHDGDVPNDCVGKMVADNCPEDDDESDNGSPSKDPPATESKVFPANKSKGPSKKTVIIAATVSSTGFILICCIVILSSVAGWVLYQRRKQQKQEEEKKEEEEYKLLDNEYIEM